VGWIILISLTILILRAPLEEKRFDPYDILGLSLGATTKEIKSAYRKLSLKYHPDKNPDPAAAVYFAESIAPAYKTLTDEGARSNYERFGHPDGKQSTKLGIALPEMLFGKGGMAPVMLITLVVAGVLLPLVFAMVMIRRMNKFVGGNGGVLKQTQNNFQAMLKPTLALQKVPEMLAVAHEYVTLPFGPGQDAVISGLLKDMKLEYDSKDQKLTRRHPGIIKAHMLVLAMLARKVETLPEQSKADAKTISSMIPRFLFEMQKIASMPINGAKQSHARSQISLMEFSQCFTQAVPLSTRKQGDGFASLMQLPHFTTENLSRVTKKSCKMLNDLMNMDVADRKALLSSGGFSDAAVKDVERYLAMIPRAMTFDHQFEVAGARDQEMLEGDVVTATIKIKLGRSGGPLGGAVPPLPFCSAERKEGWRLFIQDQSTNTMLATKTLDPASAYAAETGSDPFEAKMQFIAPPSGVYNISVTLMSDFWIGVDAKISKRLKILKRTAELMSSRQAHLAAKAAEQEEACSHGHSHGDGHGHGHSHGAAVVSESESDGDDDEDDDYPTDDGYPSDETGTSESDDEALERLEREKRPLPPQPKKVAERPAEKNQEPKRDAPGTPERVESAKSADSLD
jgi:translocation protein SEC63